MQSLNSEAVISQTGVCHHVSVERTSLWIRRWLETVQRRSSVSKKASQVRILDWACGSGRHSLLALELGFSVLSIDASQSVLNELEQNCPAQLRDRLEVERLDLEAIDEVSGAAMKQFFAQQAVQGGFDVIVVANYLHRPRIALLTSLLAKDGIVVYETFASGNAAFGRPAREDFLLQDSELFDRARQAGLRILAYESGYTEHPKPAMVQRIAAVCPGEAGALAWQIDSGR